MMLAMLFVSTTVWAQSSLTVGGVSVNLSATTEQTITGSGISGTVTYNPSSKTLYLKNATIKGSIQGKNLGTYSSGDRFFIRLTGSNTIESSYSAMRFDDCYTVLYGAAGSMLYINTSTSTAEWACIDIERSHFEVWAIRLIMSGKTMGFWGNPNSGTLTFVNSMVSINCDGGAIVKCKNVYYDDCKCTTNGATFKSGTGYVNSSGSLLTSLTVWPLLVVGNEPVRTEIDYEYGSLYSWKWSKNTKTLEITGDVSANTYRGIENYGIDGLTIKCDGSYKVESNWEGLAAHTNTNLSGSGRLILNGTNTSSGYGIRVYDSAKITVSTNELQATGGAYGMYTPGTLTLNKNSDNTVHKFLGSVYNLRAGSLDLSNMDVWTPNTYFNPTDHKLYYNGAEASSNNGSPSGTWFKSTNQFTYYDLYVAGTRVNGQNYSNIPSPYITGGTASYNNSSKTLTLNGVTIEMPSGNNTVGINNEVDGLTIALTGTNSITTNEGGIRLGGHAPATFTGDGSLTVTAKNYAAVYSTGNYTTTIKVNNKVRFYGTTGFFGYHNSLNPNSDLALVYAGNNSDYYFKGANGAITDVSHLKLTDMDFYTSENGDNGGTAGTYFDETDHRVEKTGGDPVKGTPVNFYRIGEKYNIWIAGTQITDCNRYAVGSPFLTKGKVFFNGSTGLTFTDATISGMTRTDFNKLGMVVYSEIANLNITATGTNNLEASSIGFDLGGGGTTTIKGSGDLTISSSAKSAISTFGITNLTLQRSGGITKIMGANYGYSGETSTKLAIYKEDSSNGALYKFAGSYGNIENTNLTLGTGVKIHTKWTWFSEDGHRMCYREASHRTDPADIETNGTWIRGDITWTEYPIYVAGTQLYGAVIDGNVKGNAGGFCNKYCTKTGVSYNPNTKTLTLENATINMGTDNINGIQNEGVEGLIIDVNGSDYTSTVNCNNTGGRSALNLWKNTTIKGNGTLKLTGAEGDLYGKAGTTVTLEDINLEAEGDIYSTGSGSKLIVNLTNKTKKVKAAKGVYGWAGGIELEGATAVVEPEGAAVSGDAVKLSGANATNVVFQSQETYGIWVAGVLVTENNAADILGNGVFKYDKASNTLTIKGNYTMTAYDNVINSENKDLIIKVDGNSTIVSNYSTSIIYLNDDATITGGKLTLMCLASGNDGIGIYQRVGNLTIKNANIEVYGDGFCYGITGEKTNNLAIYNSNIMASAHSYGAIYDWGNITFNGCYVEQPRPSKIADKEGDGKFGIADGEGTIVGSGAATETVIIKEGTDVIEGIDAAETAPAEIYDVTGRKLDQTRRGINIVRSKDGKAVKVIKK